MNDERLGCGTPLSELHFPAKLWKFNPGQPLNTPSEFSVNYFVIYNHGACLGSKLAYHSSSEENIHLFFTTENKAKKAQAEALEKAAALIKRSIKGG